MAESDSTVRNRKPPSDKQGEEPVVGTSVHAELAQGETYEGIKFLVPKTADTVAVFTDPKAMNIGTVVAVIPVITMFLLTFVVHIPIWVNFIVFFFWRGMYNAGLGWLLDIQSRQRRLTSWYDAISSKPDTWQAQVLRRFTIAGLPEGTKPEDYPNAFNAWIVYKAFVNLVLVNDSTNYVWIVLRYFNLPSWSEITLLTIGQYILAALLFAFFWWSKVDAHRCIGTYCWYWGDFFYRKNVNLTFDGIFELFPHPMYTVGYSSYYACALLSRSYAVLLVSIAAHISQLIFLVVVEEPHIKRTYGDGEEAGHVSADDAFSTDRGAASTPIYDDKSGLFPSNISLSFLSLDLYSASSWMLVAVCLYAAAIALVPESSVWSVLQVILWCFLRWGVLGFILWSQSQREAFTRYYERRGKTIREAFSNWKAIHGLSTAVNVVAFLCCAWRYLPSYTFDEIFSVAFAAKLSVSVALALISLWTYSSTFAAVGEFGWFYGDFFVRPEKYMTSLCYTGIYRFLNNPDAALGYAGYYGLAILTQSWTVFWLTALSQGLNMLFVRFVEGEHMRKIYNSQAIRERSPLRKKVISVVEKSAEALPEGLRDVTKENKLRDQVRSVQNRAMLEMFNIYKNLGKNREEESEKKPRGKDGKRTQPVTLSSPKTASSFKDLTITFTTSEDHSETDWVGIYRVDTPSLPGLSDGKWAYVPAGSTGTIVFPARLLPASEGLYELRYHTSNSYDDVLASCPIIFTQDKQLIDEASTVLASPIFAPQKFEKEEVPILPAISESETTFSEDIDQEQKQAQDQDQNVDVNIDADVDVSANSNADGNVDADEVAEGSE